MRGWLNLHALLLLHILKFVQYFCLTVMQSSAGQLPDTKTRPYCEPLSGPCEAYVLEALIDPNAKQWGNAHIYTGTSLSHTSLQWSLTGRDQRLGGPRKLTELSPGLLQLLDLVLQEEHGHCERQQRQKLQLGRHHDSEQPHQIIQREMMVSPCSEEEEETPKTHTQQRRWWLQSGWECVHGPLSLSISPPPCVWISPSVQILWLPQTRRVQTRLGYFILLNLGRAGGGVVEP